VESFVRRVLDDRRMSVEDRLQIVLFWAERLLEQGE
jgi:hypothetical protein